VFVNCVGHTIFKIDFYLVIALAAIHPGFAVRKYVLRHLENVDGIAERLLYLLDGRPYPHQGHSRWTRLLRRASADRNINHQN